MNRSLSVLTILCLVLFFTQCAKKGTPTGGEEDITPPKFLKASPENYSTNFNDKEIKIYFDEYIKLDDPQKQIIISPPMLPKPDISPLGSASKFIRIRIKDTLEENTTYTVNFGRSVVDNNENNPLPFFKYVFSTGSYIDSLSISGSIKDALLKEADPYISVMLYKMDDNYSDSIVFKTPPRYITNTLDSLKTFELSNLKEGKYQLVAIRDLNNDNIYNPGKEKIAFLDTPITIPSDTSYQLTLFKEVPAFKWERPKQVAKQKLLLGYRGKPVLDSLKFETLTTTEEQNYRITKVPNKDSIHYWYKPNIVKDTLQLAATSIYRRDTLIARITDMKADSLIVTTEPSGTLSLNQEFIVKSSTPIVDFDAEKIKILNKDSVDVMFNTELRSLENTLAIKFEKSENDTFYINMLPGAFTDFFEATNDTIKKTLKTKLASDYGNMKLNLQNIKSYPILVQLTDEKGLIKQEKFLKDETSVNFRSLNPGKYLIRVIYDANGNGVWDTGNYLQKIKPEEIVYFPEVMEVRANWDINQTFTLK
jgi:uncharacterized protein (DUF2141 family)